MSEYLVRTDRSGRPRLATDAILLDWAPGHPAANIELGTDFFTGWRPSRSAMFALVLGAAVYCTDKLSARADAPDAWTRDISLRFPTDAPRQFPGAHFEDALGFLSGDHWHLTPYKATTHPLASLPAPSAKQASVTKVDAVSLFSGGLDSLCGVIDLLESDDNIKVGLVAHYDGGKATSKQTPLFKKLTERYGGDRVLLRRLWLRPAPPNRHQTAQTPDIRENTTRARSVLFITAALAFASHSGPDTPVYVPENGYIGLNVPLTRARTGSASTRTTHPHFFELLRKALDRAGVTNPIINPYRLSTKGEMLQASRNPALLMQLTPETISCSHPEAARMQERKQGNCGYCFPCLIRRSALAAVGWDNETFAWDALWDERLIEVTREKRGADLRAVLSGVFWDRPDADVLRNAPLPRGTHRDYISVWRRGNAEIRQWLEDGAVGSLRSIVRRLR